MGTLLIIIIIWIAMDKLWWAIEHLTPNLLLWLVEPLLPPSKVFTFYLTFSASLFLFAAWKGEPNSKWLTPQGHKTWDKKGHMVTMEVPSPTTTNTQGRTPTWDNNNSSQLSAPSTARLSQWSPPLAQEMRPLNLCAFTNTLSLSILASHHGCIFWKPIVVLQIWQGIINLGHYHFTKLIHSHFTYIFICCR
jgi:hypothetical protein